MIEVVHVSHHFGLRPVLRDVSLRVETGELVALMGPNGMGKTTLLSVMAGAVWPLHGHAAVDGVRRRESEEGELAIRRKTVFLPAEPWLPPDRTGREWALAVGRLYGVEDERLMDHAVRLLDVFDLERPVRPAVETDRRAPHPPPDQPAGPGESPGEPEGGEERLIVSSPPCRRRGNRSAGRGTENWRNEV